MISPFDKIIQSKTLTISFFINFAAVLVRIPIIVKFYLLLTFSSSIHINISISTGVTNTIL